ncbi:hypothetical protein HPB51_006391 [Rhipicephalus microplus]|uniref:Uncharacterized protein n=1 Tax=Rhipicephalus microplus TaxID=6941 RepID=A0A9J6DM12_RHIMP|nr:hypothetical protein HPB51_006391 [Rhipicephalus microplus]
MEFLSRFNLSFLSQKGTPPKRGHCVYLQGGRLLFAEHVGHKKGTFARFMQDLLAPLVQYMTGGCYMNRDSGRVFQEAGFEYVQVEEVDLDLPFQYSYHVYGVATA